MIRTGVWIFCRLCLFASLFLLLIQSSIFAQQNDFGVWAGIAVRHKFTQRFSATLEEQIRLDKNAGAVAQHFTDVGADFDLSKKIKIGVSYRFSNNFQQTYYSKRHRVSVDLSYKTKFSKIQVMLRTRIQEQQKDVRSSETGYLPEWYSRNKIALKLNMKKKYTPYVSAEAFYLVSAAAVEAGLIDKWRYSAGLEYEFNRRHSLDFYYLVQKEQNVRNPVTDYVAGVGYVYSF